MRAGRAESARDTLLAATKDLLWQVGYDSMSPRKVLAASGAGQGSMYHHFAGKKHLAAAALDEVAAEMCDQADALFDPSVAPLDRIRRYLGVKHDGLRGCRLGRLGQEEVIADAAIRTPVARYFRHVRRHLVAALREARRRGDIARSVDAEAVAATLLATIQGGFVLSRIYRDKAFIRQASAGAWRLVQALRT